MKNINTISLLDTTLRDGGLGLEDLAIHHISNTAYDFEDVNKLIYNLDKSNIDIIELGAIQISNDNRERYCIYQDIESISRKIPINKNPNTMYVALYRGPDTPLEDIPKWHEGLCEGIRVIIRYSELQKSIDFCKGLSEKGYKVFIQPMLTMRYSDEELLKMLSDANAMEAYAIYFVDSYGYMQEKDIKRLFELYDNSLNPTIRIGFHAHNNMNLAYSNVRYFTSIRGARKIIIDSCIIGMGQGAGNLQTELIVPYLNEGNGGLYKYESILDSCEIIKKYCGEPAWGYSVTRLLPAIHKVAYKYSIALRYEFGFSYKEIFQILSNIPEELRHRYTGENTIKLLEINGYNVNDIKRFEGDSF